MATTTKWGCTAVLAIPILLAVGIGLFLASAPDGLEGFRPRLPPSGPLLTKREVAFFHKHGYLFKKGLLQGEMLQLAMEASEESLGKFFWTDLIFSLYYGTLKLAPWRSNKKLAKVAFESNMPAIAAQLLGNPKSLRLLKDAFFAQVPGKKGCDFHVDDEGFWPTDAESNGVTFWVALSHMTDKEGGGLRVVPDTHSAAWAEECRLAIKNSTCDMQRLHPECYERLHKQSIGFDMEPGDALLWERYTFHRGEPFHHTEEKGGEAKVRYSIRYVPDDAKAGKMVHSSQRPGESFGAAYPQVWPKALETEVEQFGLLQSDWKSKLIPIL